MGRRDTLIRLRRWELDEERRIIRLLEEERADMEGRWQALEEAKKRCQDGVDPAISALTLGAYLNGVREHQDNLQIEIRAVDVKIEKQQEKLSIAFQELKKIEIADERAAKEDAKKLAQAEQAGLDEVSLQIFHRRPK